MTYRHCGSLFGLKRANLISRNFITGKHPRRLPCLKGVNRLLAAAQKLADTMTLAIYGGLYHWLSKFFVDGTFFTCNINHGPPTEKLTDIKFHGGTTFRTYDMRKVDLTPLEQRKLTFDTHALVKELETNGFERGQAEVIVTTLVTLTTVNMDIVYRDMVTGAHQEIALQQIMAHLDSIRKDMVILEKSEFANLRSENEKMKTELEQIKNRLIEESRKIKADAKLDINLERSRVTDMFTEQEKKLMEVSTEFQKKNADIDRGTMEITRKIDVEVASLKTLLESLKLDTIRYLAASVFSCLAIALGFYRLWK